MPTYWMINDRDQGGVGGKPNESGVTYWMSDTGPLNDINNWSKVSAISFQKQLVAAADQFPSLGHGGNENQSHVTLFVHGYNVGFEASQARYQSICDQLYSGTGSLGLCVLYDWPSLGSVLDYLPDRAHARQCAEDLTNILSNLYEWLVKQQQVTIANPAKACKAKVSIIAHSMGNYLLQNALSAAWKRKNQPLSVSLVNQLLMVAADVDNDLFDAGASDYGDGTAIINLSYRATALYSGRDAVLGASAGLKHFGTRRLGRSGLSHRPPLVGGPPQTDNVWDIDCSSFFADDVGGEAIHSAYFETPGTIDLMRSILRGVDRGVLDSLGLTKGSAWSAA